MRLIPKDKDNSLQFFVASKASDRAHSEEIVLAGLVVSLFESTNAVKVVDKSGFVVGVLIGHPLTYKGDAIVDDELVLEFDVYGSHERAILTIENEIYRLGGKWALVLSLGSIRRIYLDADGCIPVVYDAASGKAASSSGLLLSDQLYEERFRRPLYERLDIETIGWFPSGLTAHQGINRLLCNHYLDLDSMQIKRHWPVADFEWTTDPLGHAIRIAQIARETTSTVLQKCSIVSSLTAGNESRFLLAALREISEEIDFVTIDSKGAAMDVSIATRIAREFGLRHRVIPAVEANTAEQECWAYSIGHCVAGSNRQYHPSLKGLEDYGVFLTGLGGEVGRAFFWRPSDHEQTQLTADNLIARFGLPATEELRAATKQWLASVQQFNALTQLDLAYLELRMSPWAFAQTYPQDSLITHINPMICRESYQLMLELPPAVKRDGGFLTGAIEHCWPELLDIPINRYGDYRDFAASLKKLANPKRVLRGLRKRSGGT